MRLDSVERVEPVNVTASTSGEVVSASPTATDDEESRTDRARMAEGTVVHGPAVVESLESTILIPPGWQTLMNGDGFILMTRTSS